MNFRPPSIAVGLRRLSVVTRATLFRPTGLSPDMISALDSRQMVRHAWTYRTASSLNFRFQANLESVSAKLSSSIAAFVPDLRDAFGSTDNRKTRFDLRHALDCDFVAVISRTLSQSAQATRPFGLLLACSLSGTSNRCDHRFRHDGNSLPAYTGNSSNLAVTRKFRIKLAPNPNASVHSADLLRLQNL